jgi:hypothetical protein
VQALYSIAALARAAEALRCLAAAAAARQA